MTFRGWLLGLGLAGLMLLPQAHAQAPKTTVTVGMDVDAGTLDPRKARDTTAFRAVDLIYDGLVQIAPDLKPIPNLAQSWENPEPTVWIFRLRDGVQFHDGKPVTATDVAFTFNSILDPATAAPYRALLTPIKTIEVVDAKTIKFTLTAPYAPLLAYMDMGIMPKHAVDAGIDLGINPIGSGPMKMAKWDRGSRMTLEPNLAYWGGAPAIKELRLTIIGDNTARAQAFEAGDLDLIQSPLSPQDIRRLERSDKWNKSISAGIGITYLNINTSDPLLADPAMRRALTMVVDQKTIVDSIYAGIDQPAISILLPSSWAYSPNIKQPSFDLAGARKALADLGWRPGPDGILAKDGKKLALTLATHNEDPNRMQTVEYLQQQYKSIGVDVTLRLTDFPGLQSYTQNSQHQISLLGWLNIVDPDRLMYSQFHSTGPLNWEKYKNPELDKLLDDGRSQLKLEDRRASYQKAAEIIARDVPYYVISYQGYQVFYSKALPAYEVNPRGYLRSVLMLGKKI
jgi:peptide/nickel transport system substrate-binding protein